MTLYNHDSRASSTSTAVAGVGLTRKAPLTKSGIVFASLWIAALGFFVWSRTILERIATPEAQGFRTIVVRSDQIELPTSAARKSYTGGAPHES